MTCKNFFLKTVVTNTTYPTTYEKLKTGQIFFPLKVIKVSLF